jgi:hypothetical protein
LGRDHGVAQVGLVFEVLREIRIRRQREVGHAQLGERGEPHEGVVERLGPEAVGDEADLEPRLAGVTRRGQHDRVGEHGLAALEVHHRTAGHRRLVDDVVHLGQRHRPFLLRTAPDEAVVAGVGAAVGHEQVESLEAQRLRRPWAWLWRRLAGGR